MRTYLFLTLAVLATTQAIGQVIYVSTEDDELYRLDITTCTYEFVVDVEMECYDISFHPNGNLYGLSGDGELFQIDTITGNTNIIHEFDGQLFNALTVAGDGLIYATGNQGELWTYEIATNNEVYLGDFRYNATGDLTFHNGHLYAAVTNDRIVKIDLANPFSSQVVIDANVLDKIFGIVSFSRNCNEVTTYAITGGNSNIYEIDFVNSSLDFLCDLDITVYGGASTVEFFASSPIVIDEVNQTHPNCDSENGAVTITASGGTGQLLYSLDGINFQDHGVFENLPGGTHTISISDINDCTVDEEVNLEIQNSIDLTDTVVQAATCGLTNGSITVMTNLTTGAAQYSIDGINFQSSNVFTDLSAGTYTITVKASNFCEGTETVVVEAREAPSITDIAHIHPSCGLDNGSITITTLSGTAPLQYSIDGISFQNSNTFENLSEGNYAIIVRDQHSCSDTDNVALIAEDSPAINALVVAPALCGEADGSITITATQGTGQLEYSIDGINFRTIGLFENLSAGSYSIIVKDENNCRDTDTMTVPEEAAPILTDAIPNNATCDTDNGSITILAELGTGQLLYSINGIDYLVDNVFENLAPGDYSISVKDENNCLVTSSIEIIEEQAVTIITTGVTNATCDNSNGSINIFASPGIPGVPTEYSIDGINFQTSNVFENLSEGTYTLSIRDGNNCTDTETVELVQEAGPTILNITPEHTTCGNSNGSLTILSTDGTGTLEYSIDNIDYQSSNMFADLIAGTYTLTVRDSNLCTDTGSVEVLEEDSPQIMAVTPENPTCNSDNGSIHIEAENGTGLLEYSIDGINFQSSNNFEDLPEGVYSIIVRDERTCLDTDSIELIREEGPEIIALAPTNATCDYVNGSIEVNSRGGTGEIEFSLDGIDFQSENVFSNLSVDSYTVYVRDSNNCSDNQSIYIQTNGKPEITIISLQSTTCNLDNGIIETEGTGGTPPYLYSLDGLNYGTINKFENLSAGIHTVFIKDSNDCQELEQLTLESIEPDEPPTVEPTPTSCGLANGAITMVTNKIDSEFSLDGLSYQSDFSFPDLEAGQFTIYTKDSNGCLSMQETEIASSVPLYISSTETLKTLCGESNGAFLIETTGGTGSIQISVNDEPLQTNALIENLARGEHSILLIDEAGCQIDTTITIQQEICSFYIPNVFTPDNDGIDDVFKIFPHPDLIGEFRSIEIVDRWGSQVFVAHNFDPVSIGWDGKIKGKKALIGTYVYLVEFIPEGGTAELYHGDVTLLR